MEKKFLVLNLLNSRAFFNFLAFGSNHVALSLRSGRRTAIAYGNSLSYTPLRKKVALPRLSGNHAALPCCVRLSVTNASLELWCSAR